MSKPSDKVWRAAEEIAKAVSKICLKRRMSYAEGMMAANLAIAEIAGIVGGLFEDLDEDRVQ